MRDGAHSLIQTSLDFGLDVAMVRCFAINNIFTFTLIMRWPFRSRDWLEESLLIQSTYLS